MAEDPEQGTKAAVPSRCIECGAALVSPVVCLACPDLRPPRQDLDHFARLGMERAFDIDLAELERRYLFLARSLHPDQYAQRKPEERAIAEQVSAQLNDSYRALKDPVRRAEYLLKLAGGPDREADKRTPKEFLVEILELNETLEEAEAAIDSGQGVDEARKSLDALTRDLRARHESIVKTLPAAFQALSDAVEDPAAKTKAVETIRERLNVSAYLQGLLVQIRELALR
jgi:molecular chaperone HscB